MVLWVVQAYLLYDEDGYLHLVINKELENKLIQFDPKIPWIKRNLISLECNHTPIREKNELFPGRVIIDIFIDEDNDIDIKLPPWDSNNPCVQALFHLL